MFAVAASTAYAATPTVVFTTTPPAQTNSTTAHFAWTGTGPTYKCSLDEATAVTCASPRELSGLSEGPHKFSVQETGAGVGTPVEYDWTVDLTPASNCRNTNLTPMATAISCSSG